MPSKCFVPGCRSNYKPSFKVRVFSFPRDDDLKKLWLQAIHREDKRLPSKSSKVCEQHFKPEDIVTEAEGFDSKAREVIRVPLRKHRLKRNAIPSVFNKFKSTRNRKHLSQPSHLSESHTAEEAEDSRDSAANPVSGHSSANMRRCVVPGCHSNYQKPYVSVFHFPKSPGFSNLWLKKIGRPLMNIKDHSGVCIKHFEKQFIVDKGDGVHKKRIGIKPGAVPTLFKTEDVDNLSDDSHKSQDAFNSMKSKDLRSASTSDASKESDEEFIDSPASEKSDLTPTTDRPFIAVIKPNALQTEGQLTTEEVFDDSLSSPIKSSPNNKSSFINKPNSTSKSKSSIPSPYKHLPSVSVCLNEEDRLNAQKEILKSSKRSLSTCSSSSIGSNEVVKAQPKRRKIEKPAPTVIGKQNDCYCWICHRENVVLSCIACPRAYHQKCAGENGNLPDWVCPECKRTLTAENVDSRSSVLSEISLDKLCTLLRFSLNKMKHRAGVAFHQPVSLDHYPMYLHYVIHPMDFSLLEKNIKHKLYGCTEAFLSDVKWILHNSCVFNGSQHPLSTNAKSMVKACDNDMQEIEVCPDCFMHNIVRNKYWFSEVCHKPHPLVWAKLKGFPYWPAKVVRIADGNVDARFFGAHDRAWVPVSQCYHLSKEMPTSSKPKKKGNYETALDELSVHVQLLIQKYGAFEYAPYRTSFDPENNQLMYHGINIDMTTKDDNQCDMIFTIGIEGGSQNKTDTKISDPKELGECEVSDRPKPDEALNPQAKIVCGESSALSEKGSKNSTENEQQQRSDKLPSPFSDAHQRKKMEMALQRIKGYVTNDMEDEEKEPVKDDEKDSENKVDKEKEPGNKVDKEKEPGNKVGKEKEPGKKIDEKKDSARKRDFSAVEEAVSSSDKEENEDDICLSDLIKARTLPSIDPPSFEECPMKETPAILDTAKKNDSFSLKLIETIASCKAKLGISGDMDKSESPDSDSVEEEEEEDDDEEDEEDDEESENEEGEKQSEHGKVRKRVTSNVDSTEEDASDESSSESDDDSASSDTDIEMVDDLRENAVEKEVKITKEEDHSNITDKSAAQVHFEKETLCKDACAALNVSNANVSVSEDVAPKKLPDSSTPKLENCSDGNTFNSVPATTVSENDGNNCLAVNKEKTAHLSPAARSRSVSSNALQSSTDDLTDTDMQLEGIESLPVSKLEEKPLRTDTIAPSQSTDNKVESNNEIMEDDDIYICPPVKPPTPPLICLDDGTETEPEPEDNVDNTSNKKKSPITSPRSVKLPPIEEKICPENTAKYVSILKKAKLIPQNARKSSVKRPIRTVSSEDSSDEDVEHVLHTPKVPVSGAIRTFNNRERNIPTTSPLSINARTESLSGVLQASEATLRQLDSSTARQNSNEIPKNCSQNEQDEMSDTTDDVTISVSDLAEKDAEILRLKKKLSCIFSAFQLQQWKSTQEKAELRHNMNLIIMEMRASLEADKKQTIENLTRTLEREKQRCIEETKKKQWCACCQQESRYACCWNTSYCTIACQKRHIGEHRKFCTQLKPKSSDHEVVIPNVPTTIANSSEGKKVIVLNVLPNKDVKSPGTSLQENSQQISLSKVVSPKPSVHLVSTPSSQSNTSLQYVLTTLKPAGSPVAAPQKSTSKTDDSDPAELGSNIENQLDSSPSQKQEHSSALNKDVEKAEEPSLEEIYFPSPPTVCFEGLDTALPDENVHFEDLNDESESHASDSELVIAEESSADEEMVLSDNDEVDNEMVSIGRGIDVKAKYLNKCLIYGKDAKKLTRCLVDVIFTDNLLAICSAFGNKSNVTKLTRAALPYRKVEAIIDFVLKRFPSSTRSEIVLAINMKCKEARVSAGRAENGGKKKKTLFRRLLAKEQKQDAIEQEQNVKVPTKPDTKEQTQEAKDPDKDNTPVTEPSPSNPPQKSTTVAVLRNTLPSVVCLQTIPGSTSAATITSSASAKMPSGPNILRMSRQVLIRPRFTPPPNKVLISPTPSSTAQFRNRGPTIRSLLNMQRPLLSLSNEKNKLVFPLDVIKKAVITQPPTKGPSEISSTNALQRPYIIIGSPSQRPAVPTAQQTPTVKK